MAVWAMSRMAALVLPGPHKYVAGLQPDFRQPELLDAVGPALCGDMLHTVLDTLATYSLKVRGSTSC